MEGALHVSIAAGIATADLCCWLHSERVIRAMPNTAAMVSSAVTGLCTSPSVTASDRELAERVFAAIGVVFWVTDDERMNAVTAISGSGPAYAFHFIEGLQQAAEALGFRRCSGPRAGAAGGRGRGATGPGINRTAVGPA